MFVKSHTVRQNETGRFQNKSMDQCAVLQWCVLFLQITSLHVEAEGCGIKLYL